MKFDNNCSSNDNTFTRCVAPYYLNPSNNNFVEW